LKKELANDNLMNIWIWLYASLWMNQMSEAQFRSVDPHRLGEWQSLAF